MLVSGYAKFGTETNSSLSFDRYETTKILSTDAVSLVVFSTSAQLARAHGTTVKTFYYQLERVRRPKALYPSSMAVEPINGQVRPPGFSHTPSGNS